MGIHTPAGLAVRGAHCTARPSCPPGPAPPAPAWSRRSAHTHTYTHRCVVRDGLHRGRRQSCTTVPLRAARPACTLLHQHGADVQHTGAPCGSALWQRCAAGPLRVARPAFTLLHQHGADVQHTGAPCGSAQWQRCAAGPLRVARPAFTFYCSGTAQMRSMYVKCRNGGRLEIERSEGLRGARGNIQLRVCHNAGDARGRGRGMSRRHDIQKRQNKPRHTSMCRSLCAQMARESRGCFPRPARPSSEVQVILHDSPVPSSPPPPPPPSACQAGPPLGTARTQPRAGRPLRQPELCRQACTRRVSALTSRRTS